LLFNANSVIFQLYQVNFQCDDDEVRYVSRPTRLVGFS